MEWLQKQAEPWLSRLPFTTGSITTDEFLAIGLVAIATIASWGTVLASGTETPSSVGAPGMVDEQLDGQHAEQLGGAHEEDHAKLEAAAARVSTECG